MYTYSYIVTLCILLIVSGLDARPLSFSWKPKLSGMYKGPFNSPPSCMDAEKAVKAMGTRFYQRKGAAGYELLISGVRLHAHTDPEFVMISTKGDKESFQVHCPPEDSDGNHQWSFFLTSQIDKQACNFSFVIGKRDDGLPRMERQAEWFIPINGIHYSWVCRSESGITFYHSELISFEGVPHAVSINHLVRTIGKEDSWVFTESLIPDRFKFSQSPILELLD